MKTLAKYLACNHCVIGEEKTVKNRLIGPSKLPGLSRNGPQNLTPQFHFCEGGVSVFGRKGERDCSLFREAHLISYVWVLLGFNSLSVDSK